MAGGQPVVAIVQLNESARRVKQDALAPPLLGESKSLREGRYPNDNQSSSIGAAHRYTATRACVEGCMSPTIDGRLAKIT
jgi:hypothetical protein